MQLCSTELRLFYTASMVIWACLNIAETGYELSKTKLQALRVLQPYFLRLITYEIQIVLIKSHLETAMGFWSPLLWFPCGWCAPLYPLLVV